MQFDAIDIFLLGTISFFLLLGVISSTLAYRKRRSFALSLSSIIMAGLFTLLLSFKLYDIADAKQQTLDATITNAWYHPNQDSSKINDTNITITFNDKTYYYKGEIAGYAANGQGEAYDKEGNLILAGTFRDNKLHGTGTLYRINGSKLYSGDFRHNKYHGHGITYDEHGEILMNGEFEDGKLHGKAHKYKDGELYSYARYKKGKLVKVLRKY